VHRDSSPHGRTLLARHPARTTSPVILRGASVSERSHRIWPRPLAGLTALAVAAAGVVLGATAAVTPAHATLAGFAAGNIMSDAVMGAANTMTVAQIQAFLDSKNACNKPVSSGNSSGIPVVVTSASSAYLSTNSAVTYQITGGVPGTKNGTFLCLRNSTFNGQSAAQIIYNVAQQYQINPQVLIVLLQKEQGLITDTSPNSNQYKIATGYGCPDTAACNTTYYGFQNQLSNAANLFRTVLNGGWSNYPAYTTVYVQYNPTASCGGSNVYISNYATSALYRYTPYQPNAAVLANPPGSVVACGAYGNSNFYSFFTDWFGSTQTPSQTPVLDLNSLATDTLKAGSQMKPGDFLTSSNGLFILVMQYSGQLMLYSGGKTVWQSGDITWSQQSAYFVFQTDGNLVIYNNGTALWNSQTAGQIATKLTLQGNGDLVLSDSNGNTIWHSNTGQTVTSYNYVGAYLSAGQRLKANDFLRSADWRYFLVMQSDGNLVLYTAGRTQPIWATATSGGNNNYLAMQTDGNLVVYSAASKPLWASTTNTGRQTTLRLQNDGNLVLYGTTTRALWATSTNGSTGNYASMQTDGNFVVYTSQRTPLWHSGTNGAPDNILTVQSDGNLVIYTSAGKPLWASATTDQVAATQVASCTFPSRLESGNQLGSSFSLCSANGAYRLTMQTDGNLVLYGTIQSPTWASSSNSKFFKSNLML